MQPFPTVEAAAAWEAYKPGADRPWGVSQAAHLFRRAGFGASARQLDEAARVGPADAVAALFEEGAAQAAFEAEMAVLDKSALALATLPQIQAAWCHRLLYSPFPLLEKMTLFWHNHFANSFAKVLNTEFMVAQNRLFRRHALGSFEKMVYEISRDPAMLIFLDTVNSVRGAVNENYARELMELFCLGLGQYTEQDIQQAARAFTGWQVRDGKYFFARPQHDDLPKRVFGETGRFGGDDIVRLVLAKPATATFVVRKLYRHLVNEIDPPDDALLSPLVDGYRTRGFDNRWVVETILRSNWFYSSAAYRKRIKSPTEFAVGIVRSLEGRVGAIPLVAAIAILGQSLFEPPSVEGWEGGPAWLNAHTLLERQNLALALLSGEDTRFGKGCDPLRVLPGAVAAGLEGAAKTLQNLWFQGDVDADEVKRLADFRETISRRKPAQGADPAALVSLAIRALAHTTLTVPEFQLC